MIPDFRITTDLFLIPNKNNEIYLYVPLKRLILRADSKLIQILNNIENIKDTQLDQADRSVLKYLIDKGIVNGAENSPEIKKTENNKILPDKLTLFLTNKCNLNCIYCYASNSHFNAVTMKWNVIENSVKYFRTLLKNENRDHFRLELHGGGEPFYNFMLVKDTVTYIEKICRKEKFKFDAYASTNGILSESMLQWIVKHFNSLLVSFDILPEVQNYHRKFPNSNPTFEIVHNSLKYLDKKKFKYVLRVTVSSFNLNLLKESIDFIAENYQTGTVILEPVAICGNCAGNNALKPDLKLFTEQYKWIEPYARQKGITTIYSGADFERVNTNFCYAGTSQFAVTPDGYLTNCWEITDMNHPLSEIFIFGKIASKGKIEVDLKKYSFLQKLGVNNLSYCKDCFAKWHCAGDCIIRLGHIDFLGPRGGERCITNRDLIAYRLIKTFKEIK